VPDQFGVRETHLCLEHSAVLGFASEVRRYVARGALDEERPRIVTGALNFGVVLRGCDRRGLQDAPLVKRPCAAPVRAR